MENTSQTTTFKLVAYFELNYLRYLYFAIVFMIYATIIIINAIIIGIVLVYLERTLHKPMYIFMCNLSFNGLVGSTALCPFLLSNLLSDTHESSYVGCLVQIYFIYLYGSYEFTILTIMSYDRYVSICYPLHYHIIMSSSKITLLVIFSWMINIINMIISVTLSGSLPLCGNIIEKVYCDNYSVVKLACIDTTSFNIYYLINVATIILIQVSLIVWSYIRILQVCLKSSKDSQTKAIATCLPQLLIVVNYGIAASFEIIQNRFNMKHIPSTVRIILSVYFLILPPIVNPIIYGLKYEQIRLNVKKMFLKNIQIYR
uniref:Olfactory receptor n=1 Tax=Erpetoichthys calabaricus TaxID=27687 RepID=A0A8C4S0S4_ERPCA